MDIGTALSELGVSAGQLTPAEISMLDEDGFLPLPGILSAGQLEVIRCRLAELSAAEGDRAGLEVHQEEGTDRLADLVNKDPVFEVCFTCPRVLAAMAHVLGDFTLSSLNSRAALPGRGQQRLHADWGEPVGPGDYRVCNSIWLIDDFTESNGPTRVVPGSHRSGQLPRDVMADLTGPHPGEVKILGSAGTVVIFNSHLWHGGTLNASQRPRRALHAYFCRRGLKQQLDQRAYVRPQTLARLSPAAQYVLGVTPADELADLSVCGRRCSHMSRPRCLPSASFCRGLVLLHHAGRNAAALTDRQAVVFRPGPDVTAALTARRGPPRAAGLGAAGLARVLDERRQLLPERGGVFLAQVDLILGAGEPEPHGLSRRAAIQVVFQCDRYSLGHLILPELRWCLHHTQASCPATAATPQTRHKFQGKQSPAPRKYSNRPARSRFPTGPGRSVIRIHPDDGVDTPIGSRGRGAATSAGLSSPGSPPGAPERLATHTLRNPLPAFTPVSGLDVYIRGYWLGGIFRKA
jgi:hypothetical protein